MHILWAPATSKATERTKQNKKACQNPSKSISKTKGFFIKYLKALGYCCSPHLRYDPDPQDILDPGKFASSATGRRRGKGWGSSGNLDSWETLRNNSSLKRMCQGSIPVGLGGVVRVVSGSVEVEMSTCISESSLEFSKFEVCIYHLTQQFYLQISS